MKLYRGIFFLNFGRNILNCNITPIPTNTYYYLHKLFSRKEGVFENQPIGTSTYIYVTNSHRVHFNAICKDYNLVTN